MQPAPEVPISDQSLSEYGRMIKFDEKYIKNANAVCRKVCEALKGSDLKPVRFSMSESHVCQNGKDETGVDIVAFLNESESLEKAHGHYEQLVQKLGAQKITRDARGVIHFDLDNVKVNLGTSISRGPTVGEHRRAVFQNITRVNPQGKLEKNQIEKVSVDLHDSANEFLNTQDEFDLAASRLARAWRRTALPETDWFSPLDSMLVMRNALRNERRRGGMLQMKNVFRSFLNDISNLGTMNLTFPDESIYDWDLVPSFIQAERPLLLDPINPWRNPLSGGRMFNDIQETAQEALRVLDDTSASMRDLFNVTPELTARGGA